MQGKCLTVSAPLDAILFALLLQSEIERVQNKSNFICHPHYFTQTFCLPDGASFILEQVGLINC